MTRYAALLLALLPLPVLAATYYVSPEGDDANSGSSPEKAWETLQHGADTVVAGDTVVALAGSYRGFNLLTSGTPAQPITFTAEPGAAGANPEVVIDLPNPFTGQDGINLELASWVVVEGFSILGTAGISRAGIRSVGTAGNPACCNTFRANRADGNGRWGIFTGFVDDLVIEGNETTNSGEEHGIYVSNSGDRPVIRGNLVWGNHANGIHMNGDLSAGGDGVITGALVEGNVIFDNGVGGGSGINCDGVTDSVFVNNLVFDAHASGLSLYRIDGGAPSTGNLVVNNTLHVAADGRWALNVQDGSHSNTARNNVLLSDHPDRGSIDLCGACRTGFVSDHNAVEDRFSLNEAWIDLEAWRVLTGQDGHSFLATPAELFVDPAGGDYHLAAGSPALDAGDPTGAPAIDFEGDPRPSGPGFDVGADELFAGLGVSAPDPGLPGALNEWLVTGAGPFEAVLLLWSLATGSFEMPGCPGLETGLSNPRLMAAGSADGNGEALLQRLVPAGASGKTVHFAAVTPEGCLASPVGSHLFP